MARPVTLFTGQWADLTLAELAHKCGEWEFDGLELACWGDHFDVAEAVARSGYAPAGASSSSARPQLLGDRQPPRRPGGVRPDRRAPSGRARRRGLGRRRPGGRAPARRRADEGHRARGRAARRRGRHRVHRLAGLAHALLVPAERLRRGRARLRGLRRALGADHRRLRRRGRAVRARGPPDRDRLRLRHDAQDARAIGHREGFGINFDPSHFEHQFLDSAAFVTEFGDRRSTTCTSRTRSGAWTGARRSSAGTSTSASPAAAGTSSPPATATSTSRRCSAR